MSSSLINYSPLSDLMTIVVSVLILVLTSATYTIRKEGLSILRKCIIFVLMAAICNIIFNNVLHIIPFFVSALLYGCYTSLISLTLMCYTLYFSYIFRVSVRGCKHINILLLIIFAINTLLCNLPSITHFGLWEDSFGILHCDNLNTLLLTHYVSYLLIISIIVFNYKDKITVSMCRSIYTCISITVFLITVPLLMNCYNLLTISCTVPFITLAYLFHYSSYDLKTGCLDNKAFRSHISNLDKKPFIIISLYLVDVDKSYNDKYIIDFSNFCRQFFKKPLLFKIRENKVMAVLNLIDNTNITSVLPKLLHDFDILYLNNHIPYKISIITQFDMLLDANMYLQLSDYVDRHNNVNTACIVSKNDVDNFLSYQYMVHQLISIANTPYYDDDSRVLVYCQPILNSENSTFRTAESLMRLRLQDGTYVYPDTFIPIAEELGIIHQLSLIILFKVCKFIEHAILLDYDFDRISVNFSISELTNPNFSTDIISVLRRFSFPYSKLAFELTESTNDADFDSIRQHMNILSKLGIIFYLDDYGTGYSNFSRIIDLPFSLVKFDKELTELSATNGVKASMVADMSDIFYLHGYTILFEGIETLYDEERCVNMHAKYLQGYRYSKPIPIKYLLDFFKQNLKSDDE